VQPGEQRGAQRGAEIVVDALTSANAFSMMVWRALRSGCERDFQTSTITAITGELLAISLA
jgi:hypothetical protein